jgi:hypothetical protein
VRAWTLPPLDEIDEPLTTPPHGNHERLKYSTIDPAASTREGDLPTTNPRAIARGRLLLRVRPALTVSTEV